MKLQRTWVMLILLSLLVLPTPMYSAEPDNAQKTAIDAIKKLGGRVRVKNNVVIHVHLTYIKVTDADLERLKGLTDLQSLDLSGTEITVAGLVHLKGLTDLQSLDLTRTDITDAGLVHLNA